MNHPSDIPETCCPVCHGDGELAVEEKGKVETDACALWAYRVIEKATLVAGSYSPGYLPRHEALLLEKATALVAKDPSLDPDALREHDTSKCECYKTGGYCAACHKQLSQKP
jgi:hypothetical protein